MIVGSSNLKICLGTLSTFFLVSRQFQAVSNQLILNLLEKSQLLALVSLEELKGTTLKNGWQNATF